MRKWDASQGPAAPLHTEVPEETSKEGSVSSRDHLRQANGKKKLKGSLALMVGRALKPASAGADTATKVTAVEMRTVLSFPALVCNRDASPTLQCAAGTEGRPLPSSSSRHDSCQLTK